MVSIVWPAGPDYEPTRHGGPGSRAGVTPRSGGRADYPLAAPG